MRGGASEVGRRWNKEMKNVCVRGRERVRGDYLAGIQVLLFGRAPSHMGLTSELCHRQIQKRSVLLTFCSPAFVSLKTCSCPTTARRASPRRRHAQAPRESERERERVRKGERVRS